MPVISDFYCPQQRSESGFYSFVQFIFNWLQRKGGIFCNNRDIRKLFCPRGPLSQLSKCTNVCSESGILHPVQQRVLPMINRDKNYTRQKNNVTASRVIETEIQYSMQCKIMPMNSECVACGCQLIPLSGSIQRETITNTDYLQNSRANRGRQWGDVSITLYNLILMT